MKRIALINGHPNPGSFCHAITAAYKAGAEASGAAVKEIRIAALDFEPNLKYGYRQRQELEPDLQEAWQIIQWADHLVWVHPVWWGGFPAIMKGFIDRLFLPGMAYKYRENSVWWDKLLNGKTAHIITTLDQPGWYYRFSFGRPSVNQLRRSVLEFCGIKPVRVSYVGIIKTATEVKRKKWLEQVQEMGKRLK